MEEVFDFSVRGKQNMGARNFVRQALLDKGLNYNRNSLSIKAMVRLAGEGTKCPVQRVAEKLVADMPML